MIVTGSRYTANKKCQSGILNFLKAAALEFNRVYLLALFFTKEKGRQKS